MFQQGAPSGVWEEVELSAGCDTPVLISTDDILDARTIGSWIHGRSLRRDGPFVVLDSRTLGPDVRFEFIARAHGALPSLGAVDSLHGGTLMLLHLEEMPLETQARLSEFLERREVRDPAMFRVIAATDRAFARVQAGAIREDLFYRLNVIHIVVGAADNQARVDPRGPITIERRGPTTDRRRPSTVERPEPATIGRHGPSRSAVLTSALAARHLTPLPSLPR